MRIPALLVGATALLAACSSGGGSGTTGTVNSGTSASTAGGLSGTSGSGAGASTTGASLGTGSTGSASGTSGGSGTGGSGGSVDGGGTTGGQACPQGLALCADGGVCTDLSSDLDNCGACGNVCQSDGGVSNCAGGSCVVLTTLAVGQESPESIVVDSTGVYWTNFGSGNPPWDGTVMWLSFDGGAPVTLASGQAGPGRLAVDATNVYWLDSTAALMTVPRAGGTPTTLATLQGIPTGLALGPAAIYCTLADLDYPGQLLEVALDGGTPTTLASAGYYPNGVAVGSSGVYWLTQGPGDGGLFELPFDGGSPIQLADATYSPMNGLALDSTSAYWTGNYGALVAKVALAGGTPQTLFSESSPGYSTGDAPSVAVDGAAVYWADFGSGVLRKVGLDGGTPAVLATGQVFDGIAIDATRIYWSTDNGTIMAVAK